MSNQECKEVVNKNNNMKEGSGNGGGDNKNEEREDPGVAKTMNNNDRKIKK